MSKFQPPEAVASILSNRYFQKDENWESLCSRVAKGAAQSESKENQKEWENKFYALLSEGIGLPNTPALVNLGANHLGSVAGCFSFRPKDNMESIMEIGRLAAMTLKFGGGAGFELSLLRPEGSEIQSTHKNAMGPVGVMKYYNAVGDMITQAGIRKAALIAILRIDHPDIIKFCRAKSADKALSNFNISVSIPDGFMKKLSSTPDKPHVCRFTGKQYHILADGEPVLRAERGSKKVLSVREIYNILCDGGALNGDPGIYFVDHANKNNPLLSGPGDTENPHYLHGTNPCVTGDTKVYVADGRGPVEIKTLAEEQTDVPVLTIEDNGSPKIKMLRHPRLTGKNQKILKITMTDGSLIRCTRNHKIALVDGTSIRADKLTVGSRLRHIIRKEEQSSQKTNNYARIYTPKRGRTAEHRIVAEYLKRRPLSSNGDKNGRYINISNEDYFKAAVQACTKAERLLTKKEWHIFCKDNNLPIRSRYRLKALDFGSESELLMEAAKKAAVFRDSNKIKSYRRYLELKESYDLPVEFDTSNEILVVKNCESCKKIFKTRWATRERAYCSTSCANKTKASSISNVQKLRAGIQQKETRQKQIEVYYDLKQEFGRNPLRKEWVEGCKSKGVSSRLRGTSDRNQYYFRTFTEVKQAASQYLNFKVKSIEEDGLEDVYNGTVEDTHHLCIVLSEQEYAPGLKKTKILDTWNCGEIPLENCGACILGSVDLAKFVIDDNLDTAGLTEAFRTMTRLLDDMIDASVWPDPIIEETVLKTRRLGVGVMGFVSLLDKLRIRYGTDECIKLIDIIGTIRETACSQESKEIAKEKGLYTAAPEGETHRNIARTVIAPTGTLAMIANTSWNIEPHLYWAFEEKRNNEFRVRYLPAVKEYIDSDILADLVDTANGDLAHLNNLIQAQLPEHMVLARNVTPDEHLRVVAAWQKYTESAISKTIVAPAEVLTSEKIADIYQFAWENKLKGLTVYPEGSREGEPMSIGHKKKKEIKPLPKRLKSDRHEFEVLLGNQMKKTFCFVGLDPDDDAKPIEVFLKHPHVQDPMAIQFIDLTTRLLSLALRYRYCPDCKAEVIPLGKVLKNLRETDGQSMFSVPSIFVKALAKYLPKNEPVGRCPNDNCNGDLTLIEGCESCLSCGYTACS